MERKSHILFLNRFLIWVLLLISFNGVSQTYPVQTNLSTSGPYYNYLSSFADENEHLKAVVTLTDFNSGPINARLRIRVEGPGYELHTNPNIVVGNSFTLEPGIPVFLGGIDFAPYFQQSNLIVNPTGININNLPDGFTTICVDVIRDGASAEVISTNNCTSFFLQRFQPPQAFVPVCESNVSKDEMFYTFQWTPPVGYVPLNGVDLNYTFSLYEWNDPNNYNIFQTGQGLVYQQQTTSALLQISKYDLTLQDGKQYVWRVQAEMSKTGMSIYMIDNHGLSAPCTFTYGQSQTVEQSLADGLYINLNANGDGERKGHTYWSVIDNTPNQGLSTYQSYIVSYRKKPTGNQGFQVNWINDSVSGFSLDIFQLEPATTYEVYVSGVVGSFVSDPSETVEFTTSEARVYACGESDMPYLPANYTPLAEAEAGMHFQIGQFSMLVTEVSSVSGAGHYKGKGLISVAFLGGAYAKVTFDDILVDDQYNVREGQVDVMTKGLDNWLHEQYANLVDPIYVDGTIDSAYVDSSGVAWVVVDGVALGPYEFDPPDYPIVINDDNGNQYTIWPNGDVTVNTYLVVSNDYIEVDEANTVIFNRASEEQYGFDSKKFKQWHSNYEIIRINDSTLYFVSNKSIGQGADDNVSFMMFDSTTASGITFKLDDETEISSVSGNTITIPNNLSKGNHTLYAYNDDNKRVGKLNIVIYSEKKRDVVLVPLTNATLNTSNITEVVQNTFKQANITVNITVAPQWNDTLFTDEKLVALPEDVNAFSHYSSDMRDLRDHYFATQDSTNNDAYYVFVVPGFDDSGVQGYMVRGKALGFVKATADPMVYAHELGHGIGALKHTWQDGGPDQGATNNLMDYEDGVSSNESNPKGQLVKFQWKELRDIDVFPGMFDAEEESEFAGIGNINTLYPFINESQYLTFWDISGKLISLQYTSLQAVYFTDYPEYQQYNLPLGLLYGFTIDGSRFTADISGSTFNGYKLETDSSNSNVTYYSYFFPVKSSYNVIKGSTCYSDNVRQLYGKVSTIDNVINYYQGKNQIVNLTTLTSIYASNDETMGTRTITPVSLDNIDRSNYYDYPVFNSVNMQANYNEENSETLLSWITTISSEAGVPNNICDDTYLLARDAAAIMQSKPYFQNCFDELLSGYNILISFESSEEPNENNTIPAASTSVVSTSQQAIDIINANNSIKTEWRAPTAQEFYVGLVKKLIDVDSVVEEHLSTFSSYTSSDNIDIGGLADEYLYHETYVPFAYRDLRCFLYGLTSNQRIRIWQENGEWTIGSQKEEFFVDVLKNTPPDQFQDVLDYFADNIPSAYDEMNDDLPMAKEMEFISYLTLMARAQLTEQESNKMIGTQVIESQGSGCNMNEVGADTEFISNNILSCYSDLFGENNFRSFTRVVQYPKDTDSSFMTEAYVVGSDCYSFTIENNKLKYQSFLNCKYLTAEPFEFIPFTVSEHLALSPPPGYSGEMISSDKVYWAPALYVRYLDDAEAFMSSMQDLRVAVDVFVLISATATTIPSGGSSWTAAEVFWTASEIVSVTSASIDLAIVSTEMDFAQYGTAEEFQQYQDYLDEIEPIVDVLNTIDAVGAVAGVVKIGRNALASLKNKVSTSLNLSENFKEIKKIEDEIILLDGGEPINFYLPQGADKNQLLLDQLGWQNPGDRLIEGTNTTYQQLADRLRGALNKMDNFASLGKLSFLKTKFKDALAQIELNLMAPPGKGIFIIDNNQLGIRIDALPDVTIGNLGTVVWKEGNTFDLIIPQTTYQNQTLNLINSAEDLDTWIGSFIGDNLTIGSNSLKPITGLENASIVASDGTTITQNVTLVKYGNEYKLVGELAEVLIRSSDDIVSRLDNILSKPGFSGTGGIFSKLPKNTSNQISRYSSSQSFRDEFIRLYNLNTTGVRSINEVIDDFDHLVTNYSNISNVENYVDELMQSQNKFKGGAFGLEILNNLPPSLQGKTLAKFEASIDDLDDIAGGCRFDLLFTDGTKLIYIETKNYSKSTPFTSSFYNQFKAYISNSVVTSMDDIKYYFRSNTGVTKADRAQKFKAMILSNDIEELFNSNQNLFKSFNKINGNGKITTWEDLEDLFNSTEFNENHAFFDFIEIF